jgi:hypothetical protein
MGRSRGLFIIVLLVMFIFFLSWISIIFNLEGGSFFKFELLLLALFLLWGIKITAGTIAKESKWKSLLVFCGLNWINILAIYFVTFRFREIVLPVLVLGIGYVLAFVKMDSEEIEEAAEEVAEEVKAEKKAKRKPVKKKRKKNA